MSTSFVLGVVATISVLQHNIFEGHPNFGTKSDISTTIASYFEWLSNQTPQIDVITLNELNGWARVDAKKIARNFGFTLEMAETNRGFDIGVASRFPLERIGAYTENFHHGLLHVLIHTDKNQSSGIHILATHLSPHSCEFRRREAHQICSIVQKLPIDSHVVLAGDLNTLSREDEVLYRQSGTVEALKRETKLRRKFLIDKDIDYSPMDILLQCFVDMKYDVDTSEECQRKSRPEEPLPAANHREAAVCALTESHSDTLEGVATVPTQLREDTMHATHMRLDYILATPELAVTWKTRGGIAAPMVNAATKSMSDHFPVLLSFPPRLPQDNVVGSAEDPSVEGEKRRDPSKSRSEL
jgi:endonuclease/exonuclease/phosphatase family metal-dependent hydrolase